VGPEFRSAFQIDSGQRGGIGSGSDAREDILIDSQRGRVGAQRGRRECDGKGSRFARSDRERKRLQVGQAEYLAHAFDPYAGESCGSGAVIRNREAIEPVRSDSGWLRMTFRPLALR